MLTHAVIDALLGAAGLGDLGTHFPPDEERWRDADSLDLLRTVVGMLGGPVANVDATVICEAPRLGPHRAEMERNLAEALGAPVSVKATTNEGMGFVGRGEGIACDRGGARRCRRRLDFRRWSSTTRSRSRARSSSARSGRCPTCPST